MRGLPDRTSLRILSSTSDTKLRRVGIRVGLAAGAIVLTLVLLEVVLQIAAAFVDREPLSPRGDAGERAIKVLCIGESTTHGFGHTSYPAVLQRILDERFPQHSFEVINAGLPGTNSRWLTGEVPRLLEEHDPDVVIAMMGVNDEVYFVDVEETTTLQLLLLRSRVYKLFRLLLTNTQRQFEYEPPEEDVNRRHYRQYGRRYIDIRPRLLADPTQVIPELESLIVMAKGAGAPGPDGSHVIPADYWHIYEIANRYIVEALVASGREAEAERVLRESIQLHPKNVRFRRRLVWFLDVTGQPAARDSAQKDLEEVQSSARLRVTSASWHALARMLAERDVSLVALQYPMRDKALLEEMLVEFPGVQFVENVDNFERALASEGWDGVFIDRFAGDFGHATELGNSLIAERLFDEVFLPRFGETAAGSSQ